MLNECCCFFLLCVRSVSVFCLGPFSSGVLGYLWVFSLSNVFLNIFVILESLFHSQSSIALQLTSFASCPLQQDSD